MIVCNNDDMATQPTLPTAQSTKVAEELSVFHNWTSYNRLFAAANNEKVDEVISVTILTKDLCVWTLLG